MDLRVIRYFVSTVKAGSITKAAGDLFLTQPTLTRQIKELEEELGHELIIRGRHGITLTERGALFYERALELLEFAAKIKEEVKGSTELRGSLSIIAAETPAMTVLAHAMSKFKQDHPFVRFDVISATRDVAFERLNAGSCDFAMVIPVPDKSCDYINLRCQTRWGLIVTEGSPLWDHKTITGPDLRGLPLLISKSNLVSGHLDEWLGFPLEKLRISATITLLNNGLLMAEAGLGALISIEGIVSELPAQFRFIPFEPEIKSGGFLAWKKARPLSEIGKVFVEYVKKGVGEEPLKEIQSLV